MAIKINNYLCFQNYYKTQMKVYKNAVVAAKLFKIVYPPMPRGLTALAPLPLGGFWQLLSFNKSAPLSTLVTTQFIVLRNYSLLLQNKQYMLYLLVSFRSKKI